MMIPPWGSEQLWAEANQTLGYLLERHHQTLHRAQELAAEIDNSVLQLFPLMEALCQAVCPDCQACCCRQAKPYFDFRDLLYLQLRGKAVPAAQPISTTGDRCRYLSPSGCRLPRSRRPWICTWYTCPAQRALLPVGGWHVVRLDAMLQKLKERRRLLEEEVIRVVT